MKEIGQGIRWAIGVAIVIGVIMGGCAAFEAFQRERLENCIAREYGISKDDFRLEYMLQENTVCH